MEARLVLKYYRPDGQNSSEGWSTRLSQRKMTVSASARHLALFRSTHILYRAVAVRYVSVYYVKLHDRTAVRGGARDWR